MPSCVAGGAELEPPVRTPHTVYMKEPVPHRRPGLLPTPHHQGRGGRRRQHRRQGRRRAGGGQAPRVIPVMSSTAIPVVS